MGRYLNPFTDFGFKKIFGEEVSKDLLIAFLNDLLEGEREVKDITFLNKERIGVSPDDRSAIYDVLCESPSGECFIVEMQNQRQRHFDDRSIYYVSKALGSQGEKGKAWDFHLNAVYGVFFMNFPFRANERNQRCGINKLRTNVVLMDEDLKVRFSDVMKMVYIQLPFFEKDEDACKSNFERWIYVLKNMETLKRMPFKAKNAVFEKLEEIVDVASLNKEDRVQYDRSLKAYRDYNNTIDFAREEGKEEGKIEERKNIARKLKSLGMDVPQIEESTGLSAEEIEKIE